MALGGTVVLLAASWWRYRTATRRAVRRRVEAVTDQRIAARLAALGGAALPHGPLGPQAAPAGAIPATPSTALDGFAPDPRARLWRDASLALVGIAGLALAGSLGLLPNLLGGGRPGAAERPGGGTPAAISVPGGSVAPTLPLTGGPGPTLRPSPSPTPRASPSR